jgi:hypothetical protein
MVDEHFAICLVKEAGLLAMWFLAGDIPNNMTMVSLHIHISGNSVRMFEKQCKLDGPKKKDATTSSVVYFSFAIA